MPGIDGTVVSRIEEGIGLLQMVVWLCVVYSLNCVRYNNTLCILLPVFMLIFLCVKF